MSDPRCEEIRELAPDVAAGVAGEEEHALVMEHVADCGECRRLLAELREAAGDLLVLVRERAPSDGFEQGALARMHAARTPEPATGGSIRALPTKPPAATPARPRSLRRRAVSIVAAALLGAALAGAGVYALTSRDRSLADHYRATLARVNGKDLKAGPLHTAAGSTTGEVFAYEGTPSWIYLVLTTEPAAGQQDVVGVLADGSTVPIGSMRVAPGRDSWGWTVKFQIHSLRSVRVLDAKGTILSEAVLEDAA